MTGKVEILPVERIAYNKPTAARALSVSTQTIDREIARGRMKAFRLSGRVMIEVAEINRYIERNAIVAA